jgi:hypothetical protein
MLKLSSQIKQQAGYLNCVSLAQVELWLPSLIGVIEQVYSFSINRRTSRRRLNLRH